MTPRSTRTQQEKGIPSGESPFLSGLYGQPGLFAVSRRSPHRVRSRGYQHGDQPRGYLCRDLDLHKKSRQEEYPPPGPCVRHCRWPPRSDSVKVEPCGCAQPDESDSSTCLPESGKGDGAAGATPFTSGGGQVPGFLSIELPTNSADEAKKSLPGDPGRGMVEPGGRRRYSGTLARLKTQPAPKPLDGWLPALPFFFASKNSRPNPAPCWPVAQDVKDQPD